MEMRETKKRQLAKWMIPLSLALVLGACGGNNDKDASESPSASASPSESPSESPSSSASASPSGSADAAASTIAGYSLYEDAANQVSIEYPADWEVRTDVPGVSFAILSPLDGDGDTFAENVNLVVQDLQGQAIDLAQYVELSKQQLPQVITDYEFVDEETTTAENGLELTILDYTGTQGQNELYWRQVIAINGSKAYVITCSAAETDFDKFSEAFGNMVSTFTFK